MSKRVIVNVLADCPIEGDMIPIQITWPDCRVFPVDKVLSVGPGVSPSGGSGTVYHCRISGREVPLYYGYLPEIRNDGWWMDGK